MSNTHQPVAKDWISGQQIRILIDLFRERLDECLDAIEQIQRRLHCQPTDAEVAGHHSLTGHRLKNAQNVFTFPEGIEKNGERTNVHGVRAKPDQVRIQTRQFRQQHANPHGSLGNLQLQQFFDRQAVAEIVGHGAEIVHAIRQRDNLLIKLRLAGFFDAGMQIADFRVQANDNFAVDLKDQAQHTVRGRMLRAHV